jgi:CheY-like chemotaxis protein
VRRARILLAEDDDELRAVLQSILEALDLEVNAVTSGFGLLDRLAAGGPFDLVVSDVRMPGMSGLQVALALRNAGFDMPLIIMSAFGSGELERRVVSLKNAVFVAKPIEPSTLARLTKEALARREARQS